MPLSQRRSQLIGRLRHRKTREREGLVLVEGVRAAAEALEAGAGIEFACVAPRLEQLTEGTALREGLERAGVEVAGLTDAELGHLADTEHPQGVLLVCAEPRAEGGSLAPRGHYLLLDAIQDPGNVGTLIRVAVGFALDGVLTLDGTADPWGPKAVRASAGMLFRIPICRSDASRALELAGAAGLEILVAAAGGTDVNHVHPAGGWLLVVGNEGAGVRPEVRAAGARTVGIRMHGGAESLNAGVAGGILLHALTSGSAEEERRA